ncbi:hypothetical protein E4T56_gene18666, partial [Termitomyces sp. T112]
QGPSYRQVTSSLDVDIRIHGRSGQNCRASSCRLTLSYPLPLADFELYVHHTERARPCILSWCCTQLILLSQGWNAHAVAIRRPPVQ